MVRVLSLVLWAVLGAAALAAAPPPADWAGQAFQPVAGPSWNGPVTTDDLVRLRDLGALGVSPDGRWLAFSVRQAVPESNRYIVRWFVMDLRHRGSAPIALALDGGQPIPTMLYGLPQAFVRPEAPQWSADSARFAFRRLDQHRIELWTVDVPSMAAKRIADGDSQVVVFAWDGRSLLFRTGLNYRKFESATAKEALTGLLLDGRMPIAAGPARLSEPTCYPAGVDPACDDRTVVVGDDGAPRPGDGPAGERLRQLVQDRGNGLASRSGDGRQVAATLAPGALAGAATPMRVLSAEAARPCSQPACIGARIRQVGWARRGKTVWFLKSESSLGRADGAPADQSGLYEWDPQSGRLHTVYRGADLIEDCQARDTSIYCMRETLETPRSIVRYDLVQGTQDVVADPNPMFSTKIFPKIEKLDVSDFKGDPAYAHVVFPYGYTPGRPYPLVVSQYRSKGFLRGQVGNEIPIFPLAAEGFVVVSLDRPEEYQAMLTLDGSAVGRLGYTEDLRDRRSVFSTIEKLVDQLAVRGIVDRKRMAITGLSAGAESVHYTLQHTGAFAAAITSSGIHDETFLSVIPQGLNRERLKDLFQSPSVTPPAGNALTQLAWSQIPDRLSTPLLINVGAYERVIGFEGIEALADRKRPIEVRVFPDEQHIKYHPQSYVGIYDNNVAWLKFWLQDREDDNPEHREEFLRWEAMRSRLKAEKGP